MIMPDSITEGLYLLGMGMGVVFLFLTLLVILTGLMSKMVGYFYPEPAANTGKVNKDADNEVIVAISAAIHQHRKLKK
ncbi:OadG family transporter subunit [Endozoicomonas sp. Mp262]